MKRTCQTLIALCLLLLCSQALAQHTGPYLGVSLGGNMLQSSRSDDDQGSFGLKFTPALQGGVSCGWDLEPGNPLGEGRVELEYSRRSNPLHQVKFVEGSFSGGGKVTADSLLVNFFGVLHDNSRWSPYVGAGIGYARINAADLEVTGQALGSGSAYVFAYQLGGGIEYALTDSLSLELGYRYFSTTRPRFSEANGAGFALDYGSHSAVLGLKVGF